ncbi:MAG: ISAs1 family transposase [Polyangiaceae bacterium]|nr:ISAs1 family transposase [Polyangiaceae bacterium]
MPDPRVARTRIHKLVDILVIALLAMINNGTDGWEDLADFAEAREKWLGGFLELPGGVPCADTFRRVFEALDPRMFGECMAQMTADFNADVQGKVVAIDGKTLRGSFDRRRGRSALHVISAWVSEAGITLGQIVTEEKSNEITAIPELLQTIDVRGATVTLDAMGCQKTIAALIVDGGADYALALKENHPTLRAEVEAAFEFPKATGARKKDIETCREESQGHGRHEVRRVTVRRNVECITESDDWKGLRSLVMVERERTIDGKTSHETAYYLSSLSESAPRMAKCIRTHWSIENNLHWTLDVVFGEDKSRIRSRHGAANLTQVRKLALSLLKLESSRSKKSIVKKRKIAGWEPDYAFAVLSMISVV